MTRLGKLNRDCESVRQHPLWPPMVTVGVAFGPLTSRLVIDLLSSAADLGFLMFHWLTFISHRVIFNLKAESARHILGPAIWFLEPLLVMSVFYLVFGVFFQRGGEGFAPFLLVGVVHWLWFSGTIGRSSTSIYSQRGLIQQVYVPKLVFPAIDILFACVKQVVVLSVLLVLLALLGYANSGWLFLPVILLVQLLLISGLSLLVAALVPILPDVKVFVAPSLQLLMFCSGVFYGLDVLPADLQQYFLVNPVANLIHQYREVLLMSRGPDLLDLALIAGGSLVLIGLMSAFIMKFDRKYPRFVL